MSFAEAWEQSAPLLDAALAQGGRTHALEDVRALVLEGRAQFWAAPGSACVTVLEDDPRERRLLVWLAGGALRELVDKVLPRMEAWGRTQGCRRLLLIGRPGWERALKPNGYAPLARVIAKDL